MLHSAARRLVIAGESGSDVSCMVELPRGKM